MRYALLVVLCLASAAAYAEVDYKEEVERLLSMDKHEEAGKLLEEWKRKSPGDVEAYVSCGRYFFKRAEKVMNVVSGGTPKEGDSLVLTDPETGEVMGSMYSVKEYDPDLLRKAVECLKQGLRLAPYRLDVRFGIAHMLQSGGDFPSQYEMLEDTLKYAKKNVEKLRWGSGELPETASVFIPGTLHEYAIHYFRKETAEDDEKFLRIARLAAEHYPEHPYALNDIAVYYSLREDWPNTLKYLLKAHEQDRRDSLVMANIADVYLKMGDRENAGKYYRMVVEAGSDRREVDYAEKRLKSLGSD